MDNEKITIYQVQNIDFIFSNYVNFPKAERTYFYIELLENPVKINELFKKYKNYLYGFSIQLKDFENKKITGEETIEITIQTQVCFFYMEYRILLFLDLSQSMFNFDFDQKQIYIEKIEIYTKYILENLNKFEKEIFNINNEIVIFKPKIILGIACSSNEDDLSILLHEIILDSKNLNDYYFNLIKRKLYYKIINVNNNKKIHQNLPTISKLNAHKINPSFNNSKALDIYIKNQSNILNTIFEYSLYCLDLLPRTATPILFFITDSNLNFSSQGKYNNILMQYGRIDISIQIFDLFNPEKNNIFSQPSFCNSIDLLKYIAKFTNGNYFPIDYLNDFFHIKKIESNINLLSFNEKINLNNDNNKSEVSINCKCCKNTISMFFCKKPFYEYDTQKKKLYIDQNIIQKIKFNINSIQYFKSYKVNLLIKEKITNYELKVPFYLISQARVRESFFYKRTKKKNSKKFQIYLFSGVCIIYRIIPKENIESIEGYNIQIDIKANPSKLKSLKIEYIKNSHDIELNHSFSTHVSILKNFIQEIMWTDNLISFFCNNFSEEKDFQTEKESFINKNKILWDLIFHLSIHTWHRFFDVDILESLVINKINDINDDNIMSFLLKDRKLHLSYKNQRNLIESQIFKFCDTYEKDLKIGIKLIPKSENNSKKKYNNGIMIIQIDWIRDNLMLIYIGFYQCFQNTRITLKERLINEIQNTTKNNDINIQTTPFHLKLLLTKKISIIQNQEYLTTPYKIREKKGRENITNEEYENKAGSIFSYTVGNKIILSYLMVILNNFILSSCKFILMRFIKSLIHQRIKENFSILNIDINSITLISKINVLNIINYKDILPENIYKHQIVIIYTISTGEDDKIKTELAIEPNHSFYIFKCRDNIINIYDKENFVNSVIYFAQNSESFIFYSIKLYTTIMKSIETKINSQKIINFFLYYSKNNIKNYNEKVNNYIDDLKSYLYQFKEKSNTNKFNDNLIHSLTFIKKMDFYMFNRYSKNHQNNLDYIKRIIHTLNDIFTIIQDYSFRNVDSITYYAKLFTKSTIIFFSFPSKELLLQNTFDLYNYCVLSIKFYYITIDSLKQMDKGFYDILLGQEEIASYNSDKISNNVISILNEYNQQNSYLNLSPNSNELKNLIKDNEFFQISIDEFLNNFYIFINYYVNLVKKYNDMINYLLYDRNKIEDCIKELYSFKISYPLTNILNKTKEGFDFIINQIDEMIRGIFIQIHDNYYTNEIPQIEEYNSNIFDFSTAFLKEPSKIKQKKYHFIMELLLEVNEEIYLLKIDKECSFKLFLEKINFIGEENINLEIIFYFIPYFKDFFNETEKEEFVKMTNSTELSITNRNGYSIYFDINENNDEILKQIPLYFESEKEEYYFIINQSLKSFLDKLNKYMNSFKTINEIEKLRKEINTNKMSDEELNNKLNQAYLMMESIQNKLYLRELKTFSVVSNIDIFNYIDLYFIKFSDNYTFNFIKNEKDEIEKIKADCLIIKDNDCTKELYKIPFWMKFNFINNDNSDEKNLRKITIDIKWLFITKGNNLNINDNVKELIITYIEKKLNIINRRIMIDNLRESNFYKYKKYHNDIQKEEENNFSEKREIKNKMVLKLFDLNNEENEKINLYFHEDIKKFFQSPNIDSFTINENLNIDKIFQYLQNYFKKLFSIENIQNYYKIENKNEKDQIFIVSLVLADIIQPKYNKSNTGKNLTKSFLSLKNNSYSISNESIKSSNENIIYEKKKILIQLYGIVQPSTFILKKIRDIVNEQIKLEKLNNYIILLKKKYEIIKLPECDIFLEKNYNIENPIEKKYENIKKFDNVLNSLYERANKTWDKLLGNNEEINKLDNELLNTFSDIYDFTNKFQEFEILTNLDKSHMNYIINYFSSFKSSKTKIFKLNNNITKIFIIFEDLLYLDYDKDNENKNDNINKNNKIINNYNNNKNLKPSNSYIQNTEFAFIITITNISEEDKNKDSYRYEIIKRKREEISREQIKDLIDKNDELKIIIYKLLVEIQYIVTLSIMGEPIEI